MGRFQRRNTENVASYISALKAECHRSKDLRNATDGGHKSASRKENKMGKTYRERIEAIMAEYHKVLDRARAEFMHYGEVKDDTDARLTALEDKLAAAMM